MLARPRILSFTPTRLINSMIHEHSRKVLNFLHFPRDCLGQGNIVLQVDIRGPSCFDVSMSVLTLFY